MAKCLAEIFELGMDRAIKPAIYDVDPDTNLVLNLGPGNKRIDGTIALEYPHWDAEKDPIPHLDGTIQQIHAYHFLEHLADPRVVLAECQRVLRVGGHMNIVVPYYSSNMASQDLDHKSFFTEDTWKTLFSNPYYDKNRNGVDWKFDVHLNVIMGVAERNLALVTQLVRV